MDGGPPHVDPKSDHGLCGICPALRHPREGFVIFDRPCREASFNPVDGHRYTAAGEPACVHPDKIGLDADRTAATTELSLTATPTDIHTRMAAMAPTREEAERTLERLTRCRSTPATAPRYVLVHLRSSAMWSVPDRRRCLHALGESCASERPSHECGVPRRLHQGDP